MNTQYTSDYCCLLCQTPAAETISVVVEDSSLHSPQAVTSPDAQTNISKVTTAVWQSPSN